MSTQSLVEMLQWKRPSGNDTASDMFCRMYLEPVFGDSDTFGNYICTVSNYDGSQPNICFAAHYDTVHDEGGFQKLIIEDNIVTAEDSDCLGADCTTGIWLILEMIDAGIPGVYVVHADEEVGCIGSSQLVDSLPSWLDTTDAVISFDRFGTTSIITHQMSRRTASEEFATSLSQALNMPSLKADSTGSFTDSNEYRDFISECTNLSVGYYSQHSSRESQDLLYVEGLRDSLLAADWSKLVFARDPSVEELKSYSSRFDGPSDYMEGDTAFGYSEREYWDQQDLYDLLLAATDELAEYFHSKGITASELAEEAGVDSSLYLSKYLERNY